MERDMVKGGVEMFMHQTIIFKSSGDKMVVGDGEWDGEFYYAPLTVLLIYLMQ